MDHRTRAVGKREPGAKNGILACVKEDPVAAIERVQKRVEAARGQVREILRRQEERLAESRRFLDWVSE